MLQRLIFFSCIVLLFFKLEIASAQTAIRLSGGGILFGYGEGAILTAGVSTPLTGFLHFNPGIGFSVFTVNSDLIDNPPGISYSVISTERIVLTPRITGNVNFKGWGFNVIAGPAISRISGLKGHHVPESIYNVNTERIGLSDTYVKRWNLSFDIGGSFEKAIHGQKSIHLQIIRHIGLMDIDKRENLESYINFTSLQIGISIPLKQA